MLVAAALVVVPAGSAFAVTDVYTDEAAFDAVCAGLPVEDFEEGNVGPSELLAFPLPLDENSTNDVFMAGDILPGLTIAGTFFPDFPEVTTLAGPGAFGAATSKVIFNPSGVDTLILEFAGGGVTGVSLDVVAFFAPPFDEGSIEVFGASGSLLQVDVTGSAAGTFWGVTSDEPITSITLDVPGLDNVAFGSCGDGDVTIADVVATVQGFGLPKGIENSLTKKLDNAAASLAAADTATACDQLGAFLNQVNAQEGKKLTMDQAAELRSAVEALRDTLGC